MSFKMYLWFEHIWNSNILLYSTYQWQRDLGNDSDRLFAVWENEQFSNSLWIVAAVITKEEERSPILYPFETSESVKNPF